MSIGSRPAQPTIGSLDSDEYCASFRRKVFKLLMLGYNRMDALRFEESEEPDITGELARQIRQVIQDWTAPRWAWSFSVHDDPPVNIPGHLGKRRPRIDIELELTCRGSHPSYPFEAKRLSGTAFGPGKYIGEGGLQDFLCGKYALEQSEAGMLGYVQSHTQEEWATRIKRKFKKTISAMQISPGGNWRIAHELARLPYCYRSRHTRPSVGKPITVFHCLLAFCEKS